MSTARDALLLAGLAFVACAPQVVDAVGAVANGETPAAGHGAAGTSGFGAEGGGARGGSSGSGAGTGGSVGGSATNGGSLGTTGGTGASDGGNSSDAGAPNATGCDALGSGGPDRTTCQALVDSLVHRYTFDGSGTTVVDAWGGPSGKVVNSTLTGDGAVTLAGHMSDQYVDLPNGTVSALDSATFEVWLTWMGGSEWQRIFDFGNDESDAEGMQSSGHSYLFLTPRLPDSGDGLMRLAYQRMGGGPEMRIDATRTLPAGHLTQVAVTFDVATTTFALYIDATFENAKAFDPALVSLRALKDTNNWLGRSQYAADPELNATIEEFRIYSRALNMAELQASFEAGPSPGFL